MRLTKGVYDELLTASLQQEILALPAHLKAHLTELTSADAVEYISRKIAERTRQLLHGILRDADEAPIFAEADRILREIGVDDPLNEKVLQAIGDTSASAPPLPIIPLAQSALVTNDQRLNYHRILRSELETADAVDFICPFIGNQGLNLVLDRLNRFGARLRVITTTYLGATNQRALERLAETGAQIKIVYERSDQRTALHAKAWIFRRATGFTTATVGSSNLSPRALVDGLEWNIRLSAKDARQVLDELMVTFERLWENEQHELFDPDRDREKLGRALGSERTEPSGVGFFADVHPFPHQQEALEELAYARLEGKRENLIVAATGTGKTLLAAFDYRRLAAAFTGRPKLLFVAHREDILQQSLGAFRAVMRDSDFGELNVGATRSGRWEHVFASVQSLSKKKLEEFSPDHFDIVIIDEFHHAEAPTYQRLLDHFQPKQLVALTATPERSDGRSVIARFGTPTYELRLWHALERNLLCPFHYYGVHDDTDLSKLNWSAGRYADADLDREYVDHGTSRARTVLRELREKVEDVRRMRVVAFCATIRHAEFMAKFFRDAGLAAEALHSGRTQEDRARVMRQFRNGELPIVCTVDLFNEGIDIPEINTVLFLRPTESATVFVQQLGRGLRNHEEKGALTVLDFVGQQHRRFRMDLRFRAMTGLTRTELVQAVSSEFPSLPPGCHIHLDRTSRDQVLKNLREAIPSSTKLLVEELRRMDAAGHVITLRSFLRETGLELADLYRAGRSFASLKQAAGLLPSAPVSARRLGAFLHVDDRRRVEAYRRAIRAEAGASPFDRMAAIPLTGGLSLAGIDPLVREEFLELMDALEEAAPPRHEIAPDLPFARHGHYSRDEIVAPFRDDPTSMRQGTFYVAELGLDIHMVNLRKSDREFSPTTRYEDYFVSPDRLHWESQSTTTAQSPTGQRLIRGVGRHLFFVREGRDLDGRTAPFMCLGFATPISHEGERPIKIVWKLDHAVPDQSYLRYRAAAG